MICMSDWGKYSDLHVTCHFSFVERPNSPENITVEVIGVAPADVTIVWLPPDNSAGFDIDHYEIDVLPESNNLISNVPQITINQLASGNYSVSIEVVTRCGTSGLSATYVFSVGKQFFIMCVFVGSFCNILFIADDMQHFSLQHHLQQLQQLQLHLWLQPPCFLVKG